MFNASPPVGPRNFSTGGYRKLRSRCESNALGRLNCTQPGPPGCRFHAPATVPEYVASSPVTTVIDPGSTDIGQFVGW